MKKIYITLSIITTALFMGSCDSYLDIEPTGKVMPKTVEDYRAFITSGYTQYPQHKSLTAVRTDETQLIEDFDGGFVEYKNNFIFNDAASIDKQGIQFQYDQFYSSIFYSNQIIIEGSKTMEIGAERDQLLAEAHALRAMAFFDLANLYADVYDPNKAATQDGIVLETEIQIETKKPKNNLAQVYMQINDDLDQAIKLTTKDTWEIGKNYRFSKAAIYSLKARVALYQKQYQLAIENADKALSIKSTLQNLNDNQSSVADFTGSESIMALELTIIPLLHNVIVASEELVSSFNQYDLRFAMTLEENYKGFLIKKTGTAQFKVSFRTSELYFIKAEAYAFENNLAQAKETIALLLLTRYTPEAAQEQIDSLESMDRETFITYLLEQRFKEFAFEGHRWFDLRRLDQKKITHKFQGEEFILGQNDPRYTIPFPASAKQNNPHL